MLPRQGTSSHCEVEPWLIARLLSIVVVFDVSFVLFFTAATNPPEV